MPRRLGRAAALLAAAACAVPGAAHATGDPIVIARHLPNPRSLAFGPDGALYLALAGRNGETAGIDRVLADGTTQAVLGGLPSYRPDHAIGVEDMAFGPGPAIFTVIPPPPDGRRISKRDKRLTGHVIRVDRGRAELQGSIGAVEARHDADGSGKESDPYGIAAIGDTRYVADAGANDLVRERAGKASVVTVFPRTKRGFESVPTAVRVGPDGALYVGELTGSGAPVGSARVWRVVPGHRPTVFARGFSNIMALAFGPDGSLFVAELTQHLVKFTPDGDIVRVAPDGRRTVIGRGELPFPGGVAVGPDGTIFATTNSTLGRSGNLVSIAP